MAYPYGGGITCLSNHGTTEPRNHGIHGIHGIPARMGTEYPEGGIIVAHWGQETSSVYSVCSVVLYPQHTQAGGTTAPRNTRNGLPVWARDNLPFQPRNTRNTRNTRPYGHGIPGRRHYCGALEARNIVCVFCVFSGPLSATYSGWGGTTAPRNTRNGLPVWVRDNLPFQPWHHGIHGIPARMGTEYPEGGIIVALWRQETSSVYSVCSVVLYPQHTQAGGHHGTTEYPEWPTRMRAG